MVLQITYILIMSINANRCGARVVSDMLKV